MPDPHADLIWTVSYALWRAQKHIPRGRRATGWPPSIEEFRIVAQAVVEHLELNGYEVRHDLVDPTRQVMLAMRRKSRKKCCESDLYCRLRLRSSSKRCSREATPCIWARSTSKRKTFQF
jgi:hypothetical protein